MTRSEGRSAGGTHGRLRNAASLENFLLRVRDVPAVLDQLDTWNKSGPLAGRMDLEKIGMSGHSFGAVTTEAVSGPSEALSKSSPETACAKPWKSWGLSSSKTHARATAIENI